MIDASISAAAAQTTSTCNAACHDETIVAVDDMYGKPLLVSSGLM